MSGKWKVESLESPVGTTHNSPEIHFREASAKCIIMICIILMGNVVRAEESAAPEEIIDKVKAAAEFLSESGESGLAEFNNPKGRWVWKDTYVFVFNCTEEKMLAHINDKLRGIRLVNFTDKNGRYLGYDLCAEALNPKGGWTEYWWPKTGSTKPERKISYVLKVPGQPYEVSAGIYNPRTSLKQLNEALQSSK